MREREEALLSALIEGDNIADLFAEYQAARIPFAQQLREEPWGASTFIVLDPDSNWICFTGPPPDL